MHHDRTAELATLVVIATGALWGLYWLPVRRVAELGLPGAWGTFAIVTAAAVLLAPAAFRRRRHLANADRAALASIALGGAAFALYSVGLVYGRVAIVILLFYLTPVWSTLLGRYVMGWHPPGLRIVAILIGLAGLVAMLSADGELPFPRGAGEGLALASGMLWAVATTGIRASPSLRPFEAAFVFAAGASAGALLLAATLAPSPPATALIGLGPMLAWVGAAAAVWWSLSTAALMWAASRVEPARVGILLMTEVVVGALTAAWLAHEHLRPLEIAGGVLVLVAGILEVWPVRRPRPLAVPSRDD